MIGSRLITLSIALTTGVWVQDPTSGMRAIDRKLIQEFAFNMNYPPEPDTIAYQIRKGAVVKEFKLKWMSELKGLVI